MTVDPLSLEKMESHKLKAYFTIEQEWIELKRDLDPEGYQELLADWKACEEDARYWREFETTKSSSKLSNEHGWSQIPTLVMPRLLESQMSRRFGKHWSNFRFLRYCIWYFYPKLRCTSRYHAKKKGYDRDRITEDSYAELDKKGENHFSK